MKRAASALVAAGLLGAALGASTQVVAELGSRKVTVDDVRAELRALRTTGDVQSLLRTMDEKGRAAVVDQMVLREQYALAARAEGLDKRADVAAEIDRAVSGILAQHFAATERDRADVSDAALRAYYDAHKADFQAKPRVKARHILLGSRQAAEKVAAELRGGADFAAVAAAQSIDPYTKDQGGLLGWIAEGVMVPAFEAAIFGLKQGETSEPIQSAQGFHVVRVDEVEPAVLRSFDSVRAAIVDRVQQVHLDSRRQQLDAKFPVKFFPEALKALER